jgi:hypothetical protein
MFSFVAIGYQLRRSVNVYHVSIYFSDFAFQPSFYLMWVFNWVILLCFS